jgi:hypothetical protein
MAVNVVVKSVFDDKGVRNAQQELGNLGKGIGVAFAAVSAAVIGAGVAVAGFATKAVDAAENVRQADNRLGQVAKSMGLFGSQTADVTNRLIELAEANEINLAIDAETIKLTQSKLLTFKELAGSADEAGGAFDRATMAALDLAAAGFGSAETNATQLGKALQDPIKGLTALTRSGVTFTKQEKENIKTLVESGQTLKAQDLILQAIETQVGGTAQATAKASDKMKLAFENVYETVGEALLPVFDELANEVIALTPEISKALTPVFMQLADVFRKDVIPLIKEFTSWLASPQGTKTIKDLTIAVVDSVKGFFDFTKKLIENWDQIVAVTTVIASLAAGIKIFTTVITLARTAALLFGIALSTNPLGLIVTAAALAITGVVALTTALNSGSTALTETETKVKALETSQEQLTYKIKQGGYETNQWQRKLILINDELMQTKTGLSNSAGEANRFKNALANSIPNMEEYRSQLGDTRIDAEKLVNAQRELAYYMNGGKAGTYKPQTTTEETTTTTSGPTPAEQFEEARKKVQKIIQDAQKRVAEAQKSYTKAVAAADKAFLENELKIRQDYGNRLADIIEQSKNRIRDAYKSIAQFNISTFLSNFQQVEDARLQSFNEAKKAAEEVGTAFTDVFTKGDPVQAYLNNLREKIASNKKILDTSAKLLQAGFSQTFIEQIIATGETGGIALAEGLLASSPETIREVQSLFKEIESVAGTGADALAEQLYKKQGLATQELVTLFEDTNIQLLDALAANYADYTESLADAATALKESITDITADFNEAIDEMDGKLGGLTATIKALRNLLDGVSEDTISRTKPITPGGGKTSGAFTPEPFDIFKALGPQGIESFNFGMPVLPNTATSNAAVNKPTTVINVNVATDQTQSTAQVGAVIANAINKYTANGGKLAV